MSQYHCRVLFPPSDRHDLIKKLHALKDTNSELAGLLLEQVRYCGLELARAHIYYNVLVRNLLVF